MTRSAGIVKGSTRLDGRIYLSPSFFLIPVVKGDSHPELRALRDLV
jgi:hypothetical protein